jgi:DNA polymerase-3 subunit epsilon
VTVLGHLVPLELRRRWAHARSAAGPLKDFLASSFPAPHTDCREVRFAALDLETTGLDPASDAIVSAGWVCVENLRVELSTARHRIVLVGRVMPERSAVLHGIGDDRAARGEPLRDVLAEVLSVLAGRVLVAHNAASELRFLGAACRRELGGRFLAPAVDTLLLARGRLVAADVALRGHDLRLDALRRRHNLPRYRAHDALSDAVAAAELLLAELAWRDAGDGVPLRSVLLDRWT